MEAGPKLNEVVGRVHNPNLPANRLCWAPFANKYDFPWVLSVIQHCQALLIFGKCAEKLNIGGNAAPLHSPLWKEIVLLSTISFPKEVWGELFDK